MRSPAELNRTDVSWMPISTALVLLMTPALGFFYGGLVRRKNVRSAQTDRAGGATAAFPA
jgi:ammonium transporter, Amt family